MSISLLKAKAKAKVAVRRRKQAELERKKALEASEEALIERLLGKISLPTAKDGKDGRDAPTLSEIVAEVIPLLPEPTHTTETIVQEVNPTDMEVFIKGLLPEQKKEDRPKVEVIREEINLEELGDYVTKEDLDDALRRVQDAITANQGGGSGSFRDFELTNVIEVTEDTTILDSQLEVQQINIILVMEVGITVYLPDSSATKIVWVQQGYEGSGEFKVCKE